MSPKKQAHCFGRASQINQYNCTFQNDYSGCGIEMQRVRYGCRVLRDHRQYADWHAGRTSLLRHHGPKNMSSIWQKLSENKSHHTLRAYFWVTNMQKINVLWCKGLFIMDTAADAVDDTEEKKMKVQYFVFLRYFEFPTIWKFYLCCHKIKCIICFKAADRNLAMKRLINRTVCVFWKNVVAGATYRLCL